MAGNYPTRQQFIDATLQLYDRIDKLENSNHAMMQQVDSSMARKLERFAIQQLMRLSFSNFSAGLSDNRDENLDYDEWCKRVLFNIPDEFSFHEVKQLCSDELKVKYASYKETQSDL